MEIEEIKLHNPGILCSTMPEDTYNDLTKSVSQHIETKDIFAALKRANMNDRLYTGIEEVLKIVPNLTYKKYLEKLGLEYLKFYNFPNYEKLKPVVVDTWINLQKKHEYRPLHVHAKENVAGRNLSFVTYIQIPFQKNEEDNLSNHFRSAVKRNGRIEFLYNQLTGYMTAHVVDVDKSFESKTIIFQNNLYHIVYPFYTSDEYRISVAGNINFK